MSLSKRDTFVRYLDPKNIYWEDAEGGLHFSAVNACKAFDIPPTQENIAKVMEMQEEHLRRVNPNAIVEMREAPDSADYFLQLPPSQ